MRLNETSIYTEPLKFSPDSFPTNPPLESEPIPDVIPGDPKDEDQGQGEGDEDGKGETEEKEEKEEKEEEGMLEDEESPPWITDDRRSGRRQWDLIDSITEGVKGASTESDSESGSVESDPTDSPERQDDDVGGTGNGDENGDGNGDGNTVYEVPTYSGAIHYKVPKTGYYCVGTSILFLISLLLRSSTSSSSSASGCITGQFYHMSVSPVHDEVNGEEADVQGSYQ